MRNAIPSPGHIPTLLGAKNTILPTKISCNTYLGRGGEGGACIKRAMFYTNQDNNLYMLAVTQRNANAALILAG